ARRRSDDDVREQRAVDEVDLVLLAELLDDLGPALRVGAVVLGDDLDRSPGNAAFLVHELDRRGGGALVPAPVGGANAGAVHLESDADRLALRRLSKSRRTRQQGRACETAERAQCASPGKACSLVFL